MTAPDRDRMMADAAGREVSSAVFRLVTAAEPDAFTVEPVFPGAASTVRVPAPVPALRAALLLSRLFTGEARRQVRRAREAGVSWASLAPAVDAEDAEAAYEWAVGPGGSRWDARSVLWRCPSCAELVTDWGPYNGHPDDNEHGHDGGCTRHVAEVAAWSRQDDWDDDPDDGDPGDSDDSDRGAW